MDHKKELLSIDDRLQRRLQRPIDDRFIDDLEHSCRPIARDFARTVTRIILAGALSEWIADGRAKLPDPENKFTRDEQWELLAFGFVNHFAPGNFKELSRTDAVGRPGLRSTWGAGTVSVSDGKSRRDYWDRMRDAIERLMDRLTDAEKWIDTKKAARIIGCTPEHVARQAKDGKLPGSIRKDREWRIPEAAVHEYAATQKVAVTKRRSNAKPVEKNWMCRRGHKIGSVHKPMRCTAAGCDDRDIVEDTPEPLAPKKSSTHKMADLKRNQ